MPLFCTSAKGAQPLLQLMASALYSSKLTGSAFFVILHSIRWNWQAVHSLWFCMAMFVFLNYCSVSGNAVSDWCADSSSLALWGPQTFTDPTPFSQTFKALKSLSHFFPNFHFRVQELCESRGGRPGLSVLTSLMVSVDIKQHWTVLRHWSQFVPNTLTDISEHEALHNHHPKLAKTFEDCANPVVRAWGTTKMTSTKPHENLMTSWHLAE